jgi:1-acyl-sn-glycerol-3-phosphate acyltransferase
MYFGLRVYFRRIYFADAHHIPPNQPVILACNHPNSFLDAIILATLVRRPIHFLARSDIFDKAWKRWLLRRIHLIPIYRLQEGAENLHKNEATFQHCQEILQANGIILIFSEGISYLEKRLRPLKKGTAKLAFRVAQNTDFQLPVQIVSVGINYTYPSRFREEVMVRFAKPFAVADFKEIYEHTPAKAVLRFNAVLKQHLSESIIHIEDKSDESLAEKLLIINRNNQPEKSWRWKNPSAERLELEKKTCEMITALKKKPDFPAVLQAVNTYFEALTKCQLQDKDFTQKPTIVLQSLSVIIGFPLFLIGYILNFPPFYLAQWITTQKVYVVEFVDSVRLALGFILGLLYDSILLAILLTLNGLFGIFYWLIILLLGYGVLFYQVRMRAWRAGIKAKKYQSFQKENFDTLKQKRALLCQKINELMY